MGLRGSRQAKLRYWNLARTGMSGSEIARRSGISRQAVSKAVSSQERDVLIQLLESARASRMLVEWTDGSRGVLIGTIPDLGNIVCLTIVDTDGGIQVFYDPDRIQDDSRRGLTMGELRTILQACIGIEVQTDDGFEDILDRIVMS